MSPLSLRELNCLVRDTLRLSLPEEVWVAAELSECRQAATGHCYLEFVEKDESAAGEFRAKAKGNIWRNTCTTVLPKFRLATGQELQAGMKILALVRVAFHEVYGYSLTVMDIDPTYTLGDMARRRQEIIAQLEEDGVFTLNRELPLPRPLRRIAVISAAGAAGYGDFCNQLSQSGYPFQTQLFEATMQGAQVEMSVIAALNRIADEVEAWDCVVIIRGGGAVSDLNGFETYLLAANVAQFPLPVLTGIGHERDETIIDLVAHTRLKTPTAVAAFLIETMQEENDIIAEYEQRLRHATQLLLQTRHIEFERMAHRYLSAANLFVNRQFEGLNQKKHRLQIGVQQRILTEEHHLSQTLPRLNNALKSIFLRHEHLLEKANTTLRMADPKRILQLGYSLTYDETGEVVRSIEQIEKGQVLHTQLSDGEITSHITSVHCSS